MHVGNNPWRVGSRVVRSDQDLRRKGGWSLSPSPEVKKRTGIPRTDVRTRVIRGPRETKEGKHVLIVDFTGRVSPSQPEWNLLLDPPSFNV